MECFWWPPTAHYPKCECQMRNVKLNGRQKLNVDFDAWFIKFYIKVQMEVGVTTRDPLPFIIPQLRVQADKLRRLESM